MAYAQKQDPRYAEQQRYYNGEQQDHRQVRAHRDVYNDQGRRNDTYNTYEQYDVSGQAGINNYDQYDVNPYAAEPMYAGPQRNEEARMRADAGNSRSAEGYAGGYDSSNMPQPARIPQQRPVPNNQRNPPGSRPSHPAQQPHGNNDGWQTRQGGPAMPGPMPGRMPAPNQAHVMRAEIPGQGSPNRPRPMQNTGYQSYGRPEPNQNTHVVDHYASRDPNARPAPNNAHPSYDGHPQHIRRPDQQPPMPQQSRTMPDRQAFAGPKSPDIRNLDSPFPTFSGAKKAATFQGSTNDGTKSAEDTRYSQEIYNGIVGDYAGDDQQMRLPTARPRDDYEDNSFASNSSPPRQQRSAPYGEQRRAPPPGRQPRFHHDDISPQPHPDGRQAYPELRNPMKPVGRNDDRAIRQGAGAQFPLPERPGTAPSASAGASSYRDLEPRFRDQANRPLPDRSRSDFAPNHATSNGTHERLPPLPNALNGPGGGQMANAQPNPPYGGNVDNYNRPGADPSRQPPQRGPLNHQHNYSDPVAMRAAPMQSQSRPQGYDDPGTTVPDWNGGPGPMRPSMDDGRRPERYGNLTFAAGRGPPPDQRGAARSQLVKPEPAFSNGSQPATSSPRFAPAQMAPRPQSPMRRPSPHANGPPPLMNGQQSTNPYGGPASHSFEQLPRPSMERAGDSSTSMNKRVAAALPNRANVERPNFYPATGKIMNSPPTSFAQPAPQSPLPGNAPNNRGATGQNPQAQQRQGRENPDALPYHATPANPGPVGNDASGQPLSRPPPVRQYQSEALQPGTGAASGRKPSLPVTQEELSRLREIVRTHPADMKTQLILAKKLGEVARSPGDGGANGALKVNPKDQERYNVEAFKLVKKLVSNEHMDAMFYLAECYGDGTLGLPNSPKDAFTYYQSAAKLGHPASAYRTAVCCEIGPDEGGGTRKDLQKALQWYKRAAALGDVPATYKMGIILLKGLLGQEKSVGEAVAYLKRAAERADEENPHALHELGLLYESPKNPGLIVRDEAQAFGLFTKAAKLGYKFSQFKLGQAYEYGLLGCKVDARNSIIWYTKAAAQGEHQSELALSGWYLTGSEGILEHSDTEAYLWARKAALAEPPLPKAMFAMGYFTEVGIGCPRSLEEAKRWYGRAAAYKFPKAQEHLEELQRGGSKVQKNREKLSRNNPKQEGECIVM